MSIDRDIESWLRLGLIKGLSGGAIRKLLTAFGSPDEIFATNIHSLERVVKNRLLPVFFSVRWMREILSERLTGCPIRLTV